jgi:hypothetical protein
MPSFRRIAGCVALAAAFSAAALPARAAFSYMSPAQTQAYSCRTTTDAGQFAASLPICLAAAATFKQIGDGEKLNPWYSYELEGRMLEAAAVDYAGLKRHREAFDTAMRAHRLLLYVYRSYKMDADDYASIAAITSRLAALETAERSKL